MVVINWKHQVLCQYQMLEKYFVSSHDSNGSLVLVTILIMLIKAVVVVVEVILLVISF